MTPPAPPRSNCIGNTSTRGSGRPLRKDDLRMSTQLMIITQDPFPPRRPTSKITESGWRSSSARGAVRPTAKGLEAGDGLARVGTAYLALQDRRRRDVELDLLPAPGRRRHRPSR